MSHPTTHKYLNTWKVVVKELRKRENVDKEDFASQSNIDKTCFEIQLFNYSKRDLFMGVCMCFCLNVGDSLVLRSLGQCLRCCKSTMSDPDINLRFSKKTNSTEPRTLKIMSKGRLFKFKISTVIHMKIHIFKYLHVIHEDTYLQRTKKYRGAVSSG